MDIVELFNMDEEALNVAIARITEIINHNIVGEEIILVLVDGENTDRQVNRDCIREPSEKKI